MTGKIQIAMATKYDSLIVSEVFEITGRGTAVFFRDDPPPLYPLRRARVRVTAPNGQQFETMASIEGSRKAPTDDVLAMLFADQKPPGIPQGSKVEILEPSQC